MKRSGNVMRLADWFTIVLCIVAFTFFAKVRMTPAPSIIEPQGLRIDSTIVDFGKARQTLIMALRSDCVFCRESMPFYRRLIESGPTDVQIVVAAPTRDASINDHLASEGVKPDSVVLVRRGVLPVAGTPTLLLLDRRGVIIDAWAGRLNDERETEVLGALGAS